MTPEGRVKAAVKKELERWGLVPAFRVREFLANGTPFDGWYYMPVQSRFSVKGIPDFVGIWKSVGWGIETKAGDNEPTAHQQDQLQAIEHAGGVAAVVSDVSQLADFRSRMEQVWMNTTSKCPKR